MILLGMTRQTKKKIGKLRGGAVEHLNAAEMGIPNGAELRNKVDMYTISAHGSTTRDNKFIVVPENTFMFFTARSGTPAKGDTPSQDVYLSYRNEGNRDNYYNRLHTQLFKPYNERAASGVPQYLKNLYVYEPGDIIPDYLLSFNNTVIFMFRHGLYRLPVQSISGSEGKGAYIGRPLYYIKKLLIEGRLSDSDLEELDELDKQKLRTMDLAALKDGPTTDTRNFKKTELWKKIERMCCRGEDNLLFQPPFDVDAFVENEYAIRLSTVLKNIPYDESKPYRFFFMLYCRVSYEDVISGLSARELEVPRLLRTLSFSGKCKFETRDYAFNLIRIRRMFCELPVGVKALMLENTEMRDLVRILKKATYPPGGDMKWWRGCLDGTYYDLPAEERFHLFEDYKGYLGIEDIRILLGLYNFFVRTIGRLKVRERKQKEKAEAGNSNAQLAVQNLGILVRAYEKLGLPFRNLATQLERQTELMDRFIAEKRALISEIYSRIHTPYRNKRLPIPPGDYLYLTSSAIDDLQAFLRKLQEANTIKMLNNNAKTFNNNSNTSEIQDLIEHQFMGYSGVMLVSRAVEEFGVPVISDASIDFENSNNENGNGNGNEGEGRGGRRKTKKKSRK